MGHISRRQFVHNSSLLGLGGLFPGLIPRLLTTSMNTSTIKISKVSSNFEREPLARPFGFKGSAMTNVWQVAAMMEREDGVRKIGLGTQNVLWSDANVFASHSENGGNALMYAMTERALQMVKGQSFTEPVSLLDSLLEELLAYGGMITNNFNLRKTFALNALVPVDNAAWLQYADVNGHHSFDEMLPDPYQQALSTRHSAVAAIPALSYGTSMDEIKGLADQGFFIMKIKIGAPGDQEQMLARDMEFVKAIHDTIGHYETTYTENGKIPYYFDANGRYENKANLQRLLDYMKKIGAFDQLAVVEEPFGEFNNEEVGDLGVIVAADESAHTDEDALRRIEQGYGAIALKAIAKTLSMTLKIVKLAAEKKIPCFCADLTVNPALVEWNKAIAARLAPFPGMSIGLQETNGWQNYKHWEQMMDYHPSKDASWVRPENGVYHTEEAFFTESGGILKEIPHFVEMFE